MIIRKYSPEDNKQIVPLIGAYRVFLAGLKLVTKELDLDSAKDELQDYLSPRYSLFVASEEDEILGYLVCRIDQDVVWAESLFVKLSARRKGIGSALYAMAEEITGKLGCDTVYNWIHPNNSVIIQFLKKRGYDVLNLIEIRRSWKEEKISSKIIVGDQEFRY